MLLLAACVDHGERDRDPGDTSTMDWFDSTDTTTHDGYDSTWYDSTWYDSTWYDSTWYDTGYPPPPPPEPLDTCLVAGGTLEWNFHSAWRPAVDPWRVVVASDAVVAIGSDLLISYENRGGYGGFSVNWSLPLDTSDGLGIAIDDDSDELYALDDANRLSAWDLVNGDAIADLDTSAIPPIRSLAAGYRRVEVGGAILGWWSTIDGSWTERAGPVTDVARVRRVGEAVYAGGTGASGPTIAAYVGDAIEAGAEWRGGGGFVDIAATDEHVVVATVAAGSTTLTVLDPASLTELASTTVDGSVTRLDAQPSGGVFVALDDEHLRAFSWDGTQVGQADHVDVRSYGPALDLSIDPSGTWLLTVNDEGGYAWWTCHPPE